MARIDDVFDSIYGVINDALSEQRDFFASAFGKENQQQITLTAEKNRQKLESWKELLDELKDEMSESGLFVEVKTVPIKKHRPSNDSDSITETKTASVKKHRPSASLQQNKYRITAQNKPTAVTFLGQKKDIQFWKDIPLFACQILYEKHPQMFIDIDKEPTLLGKKQKPYITTDKKQHRRPIKIIGSPYYLEINLNQEYCKKITYLILDYFGYKPSDIFIEETYTGSAVQENAETNYSLFESKSETGIGKRAKNAFAKLLTENMLSEEELMLLCNDEYSKKALNLNYPALRVWPVGMDGCEVRKGKDGRPRYYKNVYTSRNKRYFVCSQWFEHQTKLLESYLKKHGVI